VTAAGTAYEGGYQTANGPLRISREGDRLFGSAVGLPFEFVPPSDTQFVMLAVGALDEELVEFVKQADRSVIPRFQGQPLGLKK